MYIKAWRNKKNSLAAQSCAVAGGGKARVSACGPLCAILLRKPSVYPISGVKANVGRLCEKLKIGMRNGLEQRCDGNFLAIFAGVSIGEKPNFTGRFFEWRRPFDKSTDRLCICQAEISLGIHGTYSLLSLITDRL